MKKRLFVWVLFLAAVFGVYKAVQAFRNPWAVDTSAITEKLPVTPIGCSEGCE